MFDSYRDVVVYLGRVNPNLTPTQLITFADELTGEGEGVEPTYNFDSHDDRVRWVIDHEEILTLLRDRSRKIQAIKEVRNQIPVGLKEAKDAVEDKRVGAAIDQDDWPRYGLTTIN